MAERGVVIRADWLTQDLAEPQWLEARRLLSLAVLDVGVYREGAVGAAGESRARGSHLDLEVRSLRGFIRALLYLLDSLRLLVLLSEAGLGLRSQGRLLG